MNNMSTINGKQVNIGNTSNSVKVANSILGSETEGNVFFMGEDDPRTLENMAKREASEKFNEQVEEYKQKLDSQAKEIQDYVENMSLDINNVEIKPSYEGVLIKPLAQNPFQKILVSSNSGLIIDAGGYAPKYKSNETGEWEEEESFVKVGVVQEVGPTCKYILPGDTVFWRKPSETPIPFYKQGLVLVNEHSIMAIVNVGLTERFKNGNE